MARLIDEALTVASCGYDYDPRQPMRGAMLALMAAGMLRPRPGFARVSLVRELPKARRPARALGAVVRPALPRGTAC